MTIYSALVNQNKIRKASFTTVASSGSVDCLFATIPGWVDFGTIQFITVSADISGCDQAVTIADVQNMGVVVYENTPTATQVSNAAQTAMVLDDNGSATIAYNIPLKDETRSNFAFISLHNTGGNMPAGVKYTITIKGIANLPSLLSDVDTANVLKKDPSFRVLRLTNGKLIDMTSMMVHGNLVNNAEIGRDACLMFADEADKLYIGSGRPISKLRFIVPDSSKQETSNTLDIKYLKNDDSWESATIDYNGTAGELGAIGFQQSGIIKIANSTYSDAKAAQLTTDVIAVNDPLYDLQQGIHNGTAFTIPFLINPDRYWLELSMDAVTGELSIAAIQLLEFATIPPSQQPQ